jgi:hypothetical protein
MSVFVSIAAYRDPELVPTIRDCLAKARWPMDLRFGICWQHGPEERSLPFQGDPRFRILDVDWRRSRGACWARSEIMGLYAGEAHFLQLDSHHRCVEDWDARLLAQLERTGSPRPILSTYAPAFTPGDPASFGAEPTQMHFAEFTPQAIVLFRATPIPDWRGRTAPVRARFLSAHFLFAPGRFVGDVRYDPDLYFTGEEITLAVRAFTHGYDLFHPTEVVVWHEYTRAYRAHKHWSDHLRAKGVAVEWHERDRASLDKVQRFLEGPWVGPDGCGTARTVDEYEAYAGLSFKHRRAQDYTRQGLEPPNPPAAPDWAERAVRWQVEIDLDRVTLPAGAERARFWYVGFHDTAEHEIHREDVEGPELRALLGGDGTRLALRRAFDSQREPASWTVWPYADGQGWLDRIQGPVSVRRAPVTTPTGRP